MPERTKENPLRQRQGMAKGLIYALTAEMKSREWHFLSPLALVHSFFTPAVEDTKSPPKLKAAVKGPSPAPTHGFLWHVSFPEACWISYIWVGSQHIK